MGRARELGEQWQKIQVAQYRGDDPNREVEDTMNAFADGIKYNVAVENQCSRLQKETALWQGPALRSLRNALDPEAGRWVAVEGEFGGVGEPARNVTYRAKVAAKGAAETDVNRLLEHTDQVTEIQNTLREGVAVRLVAAEIEIVN